MTTKTHETLAKLLLDAFKLQSNDVSSNFVGSNSVKETILDGTFDLLKIAEFLMETGDK